MSQTLVNFMFINLIKFNMWTNSLLYIKNSTKTKRELRKWLVEVVVRLLYFVLKHFVGYDTTTLGNCTLWTIVYIKEGPHPPLSLCI